MFFTSIKEINRVRKEINRLLSKRMSNIHLKVQKLTFSNIWFSKSKYFVISSVWRAPSHEDIIEF